jgi:hypothetical protein
MAPEPDLLALATAEAAELDAPETEAEPERDEAEPDMDDMDPDMEEEPDMLLEPEARPVAAAAASEEIPLPIEV